MSFLDPRPLSPAALDAATADKINTPGSATKTALNATVAAAVAPILARPTVAVNPAVQAIADSVVHVRVGPATNAVMLRPADSTRQVTIIQNLGANAMMVAESTNNSFTAPTNGHVSVPAGSEYVTASARSVWAYMSTTAATARVYTIQGA